MISQIMVLNQIICLIFYPIFNSLVLFSVILLTSSIVALYSVSTTFLASSLSPCKCGTSCMLSSLYPSNQTLLRIKLRLLSMKLIHFIGQLIHLVLKLIDINGQLSFSLKTEHFNHENECVKIETDHIAVYSPL